MTQYWPYEQSEELNNEVAFLFESTKKKLYHNLSNQTYQYLYLDILDNRNKNKLFVTIIQELEDLILEIVEYSIEYKELQKLNYQLLNNFIQKIIKNSVCNLNKETQIIKEYTHFTQYQSQFNIDHQLLLGNILIYLIFGSSYIEKNIFTFNTKYTPKAHIRILLENFIIQIGNLVIKFFFDSTPSSPKLIQLLTQNQVCDNSYISIRTLTCLKNNITWQNIIYQYIGKPKLIYNSRCQVWLISSQGLIYKYIYTSRISDIKQLNKRQSLFLLIIELQDLLIPKIEKILIILSKIILYILINTIINCTLFLIKTILNHFNR